MENSSSVPNKVTKSKKLKSVKSQESMFFLKNEKLPPVLLEKSISENNLLNWMNSNNKCYKKYTSGCCNNPFFISRGIYKYKNPVDEIRPTLCCDKPNNCSYSTRKSISMENIKELNAALKNDKQNTKKNTKQNTKKTPKNTTKIDPKINPPDKPANSAPTMVINEEGEIIQGATIQPLIYPPCSKTVIIGEITGESVFNIIRISRKWDYPLKYVIGFNPYFINSCCQFLNSHINQFTAGGAFINGSNPDILNRVKHDLRNQNYCLCVDISNFEELEKVEPLLQNAGSYIICSKISMLSRLAPYAEYLFISKAAGISRQYEANMRRKSLCMVSTRNMLKYSMGYKLSILAYYLDKLKENEYIVALKPFNSIVMNLWYLPCCKKFRFRGNGGFYYPLGCMAGYFSSQGNSHKKTIKKYYTENYKAKKMQTVIAERSNPLSFLHKDYLPKDVFLVIFEFAFNSNSM